MKIIPALFLAAGILMTVSCAHLEPALPSTAKPDSQSAMLYGRFSIGHNFAFKNKLALWLETVDTKHAIYIYFDENEPLYGIQVKPGHYRIVGFAGLNRTHEIKGRRTGPLAQKTFLAPAGSEIYIGDFAGEVTWDGMVSTWRLKSCTNNFAVTTAEFREKYPNLTALPPVSIFEPQEAHP
jgi:hypothetical protein